MNCTDALTIETQQESIIQEFSDLGENWLKKYEHLIKLGQSLPPINPEYKTEENLITGCQSQVWLHSYLDEGKVYFEVDCDSLIIKGMAALLVRILSGHTPQDIKEAELYSLDEIGLRKHLSPTRSNGLASLIKQMRNSAEAENISEGSTT